MTSTECEMSLLPPEQCSHCRGLDERETPERATATSNAWFDSYCPNCSHPILARDQIGLVEGEWLCSGCYDTADDPDDHRDLIIDDQMGVR